MITGAVACCARIILRDILRVALESYASRYRIKESPDE